MKTAKNDFPIRYSISLSESDAAKIADYCNEFGVAPGTYIRIVLREFLSSKEKQEKEKA